MMRFCYKLNKYSISVANTSLDCLYIKAGLYLSGYFLGMEEGAVAALHTHSINSEQFMTGQRSTKVLNVLLLEDEPNILKYLEAIIREHPLVKTVYGTSDGHQAVQLAREKHPNIAFINIALSSKDTYTGLKVARLISAINPTIKLVFIADHSCYALSSFVLYPYEYVVKPINKVRIINTLTRLASYILPNDKHFNKIIIPCDNEIVFLDPAEILFFEKEGKKTIVHTRTGAYTFSQTLNDLSGSLPEGFFRTHKSFIVNTNNIKVLRATGSRSWQVVFEGYDQYALLSRYKYRKLQEELGLSSKSK